MDCLLASQYRLVWKIAQKRAHRCLFVEVEDLVQVGMVKVVDCIDKFDLSRGTRLTTVVSLAVGRAMDREITTNRNIHVPAAAYASPTTAEFAERACATISMQGITKSNDRELQSWLNEMMDLETPDTLLMCGEDLQHGRNEIERLRNAINQLPPRMQEVIQRRLAGEMLREIGAAFGCTRERVRQLELKAMNRLREILLPKRTASA